MVAIIFSPTVQIMIYLKVYISMMLLWRLLRKLLYTDMTLTLSSTALTKMCKIYIRHEQYWQIAYHKFLVPQNCIKKDLYIIHLRKLSSRFWGQFSSTALAAVQSNIWHKKCLLYRIIILLSLLLCQILLCTKLLTQY